MSLGPVHPSVAARARELLGLPPGAPLTQAQMWEAAHLETAQAKPLPELLTCDDPRVRACTADGVDHDYRPHTRTVTASTTVTVGGREQPAEQVIRREHYLRCVWCHAVTCGSVDETDPCIEPYHHRVPHRTRLGTTWPIGGVRPDPTPKGTRP